MLGPTESWRSIRAQRTMETLMTIIAVLALIALVVAVVFWPSDRPAERLGRLIQAWRRRA